MKKLQKIDKHLERFLKPFPHLSSKWRNMISENVWWVSMLAAIVMAVIAFSNFVNLLSASKDLTLWWYMETILSTVLTAILAALLALASSPLEMFKRRGWNLLALAFAIVLLISIVNALFYIGLGSVSSLFSIVMLAIVGTYLIYEVKGNFHKK